MRSLDTMFGRRERVIDVLDLCPKCQTLWLGELDWNVKVRQSAKRRRRRECNGTCVDETASIRRLQHPGMVHGGDCERDCVGKPFKLEPCCGQQAITNVIQPRIGEHVVEFDIQHGTDFLEKDMQALGRFDFVITNSPYTYAQEFVDKSLKIANCVIMLLR
jgi:hypothetical protein